MRLLNKKIAWLLSGAFILATVSFSASAAKQAELLTEKKVFDLGHYTTVSNKSIKGVKIGYETYGTLNANKSNAILICHFFSGNSHAAGKYSTEDAKPGYWNNIIGPDKIIDTNKYFVISSDTLVNLGVHNPKVTTTGPASINPGTGKPYGLDFPLVTMEDFVNVQKELVESFGIKKLHGVAGASMGSIQAITWVPNTQTWSSCHACYFPRRQCSSLCD